MSHPRQQEQFEAQVRRLRAEGQAFAVATIVRTVDATSAKPGAKALVLADGSFVEGWVGGGCARAAVSKAAAVALREGKPQFVSLRPEDLLAAEGVVPGEERDGIRFARNGCPSRGSMDIFVEPELPQPRLVIFGGGPVALALADLAARFDLHRTLCGASGGADVEAVQDGFVLETGSGAQRFVVVATQGKGDEAALRAAIASGAGYVAFVGSTRKFATLSDRLAADGIERAALAKIRAPAGLNIHAITPDEIALSILAEIVSVRRAGERGNDNG